MPPKSPKTGFGLTTYSSMSAREARMARAYGGEDVRADVKTDARHTTARTTKPAPPALRLTLGGEAGTVRGLKPSGPNGSPGTYEHHKRSPNHQKQANTSDTTDPSDPPTITIRVLDDANNEQRKFKRLLKPVLLYSRYFREHLSEQIDNGVMDEINREIKHGHDDRMGSTLAPTKAHLKNRLHAKTARGVKKKHVQITVHCDAVVFGELLRFIDERFDDGNVGNNTAYGNENVSRVSLTVRGVVPVLVASQFLGIDFLVEKAVTFLGKDLPAVCSLTPPVGVANLGDSVLRRLAETVSHEILEHTVSVLESMNKESKENENTKPQNFFTSRLYRWKLPGLLNNVNGGVSRCSNCARVYPTEKREELVCAKAINKSIAFDGDVIGRHIPLEEFDAEAFVKDLAVAHDPRHVFWYIWGATRTLPRCRRCRAKIVLAQELEGCRYHPGRVVRESGRGESGGGDDLSTFVRSCCGAPCLRFDAADSMLGGGCCVREHAIECVGEFALTLATTRRRRALAVEPFFGRDEFGVELAGTPRNSVFLSGDHTATHTLRVPGHVRETSLDSEIEVVLSTNYSNEHDSVRNKQSNAWPVGAFASVDSDTRAGPVDGSASSGSDSQSNSGSGSDATSDSSDDSDADLADMDPDGKVVWANVGPTFSVKARAAYQTDGVRNVKSADGNRGHRQFLHRHVNGRAASTALRISYGSMGASRVLRGRPAAAAAGTQRAPTAFRKAGKPKPELKKLPGADNTSASFGLPREAYDLLPEKFRRTVRRDALREQDAARIAELEEGLRGLRREETR